MWRLEITIMHVRGLDRRAYLYISGAILGDSAIYHRKITREWSMLLYADICPQILTVSIIGLQPLYMDVLPFMC